MLLALSVAILTDTAREVQFRPVIAFGRAAS